MASMTLKGLYLKDIPWRDVPGTWTGFVDICGAQRLVVALEVVRCRGGILKPMDDPTENDWLTEELWRLMGCDWERMTPVQAEDDTQLFLVFMPP